MKSALFVVPIVYLYLFKNCFAADLKWDSIVRNLLVVETQFCLSDEDCEVFRLNSLCPTRDTTLSKRNPLYLAIKHLNEGVLKKESEQLAHSQFCATVIYPVAKRAFCHEDNICRAE